MSDDKKAFKIGFLGRNSCFGSHILFINFLTIRNTFYLKQSELGLLKFHVDFLAVEVIIDPCENKNIICVMYIVKQLLFNWGFIMKNVIKILMLLCVLGISSQNILADTGQQTSTGSNNFKFATKDEKVSEFLAKESITDQDVEDLLSDNKKIDEKEIDENSKIAEIYRKICSMSKRKKIN